MGKLNCFSALLWRKKKSERVCSDPADTNEGHGTLQVKLEHLTNPSKENDMDATSFNLAVPYATRGDATCKVKVLREENLVGAESAEAAYEGEDEHEENLSMKRDFSDCDLQAQLAKHQEETDPSMKRKYGSCDSIEMETNDRSERDEGGLELLQTGHVSDPGICKTELWGSPMLKRSCSNLESRDVLAKIGNQLPPSNSESFEDLQKLTETPRGVSLEIQTSPLSVMTSCSADKVMLRRRSSSQVLPSRSKRLWWKLFLWSHRNLHRPEVTVPKLLSHKSASNQKDGGYSSDPIEPSRGLDARKKAKECSNLKSPLSGTEISCNNNQKWDNFQHGISDLWPGNQWVAFSVESSTPLSRVDAWVNSLDTQPFLHSDYDGGNEGEPGESIVYPPSPENGESTQKNPLAVRHSNLNEEVLQANNIIQSLNSFSTVAHIAGMGLKVIPNILPFSSLRTINLSGNFIVHITPGSLPKSLHTLNLSRNKIVTIEGLRELTRLRVLDLSYNKISRIGHGLSNCTLIKELYLAGNKISDVEGLHRLLKLTVLDLSFNKISTAKALGQLVANYHSLLALNLLGNPIQTNISDDQLRKAVSSLLPRLAYLNKQPIKPQRARELLKDSVAKAALGHSDWSTRRKVSKRATQGSSTVKGRSSERAGHRSRHHRAKSNHQSSAFTRR